MIMVSWNFCNLKDGIPLGALKTSVKGQVPFSEYPRLKVLKRFQFLLSNHRMHNQFDAMRKRHVT